MTIYRIDQDKDEANPLKLNRDLFQCVHPVKRTDCLSGIAKLYFKGFALWPMIWLDNWQYGFENPNKIPFRHLAIRRPDKITLDDRIESKILFDCWDDNPRERQRRLDGALQRITLRRTIKSGAQWY